MSEERANEEYPRCTCSASPFTMDDWTHIGEQAWGHIASDFFSMPVIRRQNATHEPLPKAGSRKDGRNARDDTTRGLVY